jgi:hypothetical protein
MTFQIMAMIISWCAGAKTMGPPIVNEPTPEVKCRIRLVKCYDDQADESTISAECLKKSMEDIR